MDHTRKLEKSQAKKERCRHKEFKRGKNINEAFDTLQQHIPFLRSDERKSLSKIKALRLAKKYIEHLTQLAEGNQMADPVSNETRPLELTDFRQVVTDEMRSRNSYRERAFSEEMEPEAVQRILTREQRRRRFPMDVKDHQTPQTLQNHTPAPQFNVNQYNVQHMTVQAPMMMVPHMINEKLFHPEHLYQISSSTYTVHKNVCRN
ncbi:hypothetical protein L5515_012431 [Caenorhabditis briggsae]|uniref:BHLH domain-containing protein n=1 Tax=Caenorhabditis briggsae TaxID=6238 RepID=A0AAE9JH29_CAEBR|nr:hypothetical protein L5515_012431 [Caenorhabditis briggsae]